MILFLTELNECTSRVNQEDDQREAGPEIVLNFVYTAMACTILLMLNELVIIFISTRGSISNAKARRSLTPALFVHAFLTGIEFIVALDGLFLVLQHIPCPTDLIYMTCLVGLLLGDVLSILIFAHCVIRRRPRRKFKVNDEYEPSISKIHEYWNEYPEPRSETDALVRHTFLSSSSSSNSSLKEEREEREYCLKDLEEQREQPIPTIYHRQERKWERRCSRMCTFMQCFTCNLFGGAGTRQHGFSIVAQVMSRFFHGRPDIVFSDLLAGFVLLSAVQAHEENETHEEHETHEENMPSTRTNSPNDLSHAMDELAYYSKYAIGIYGWLLFVWSHPWTGFLKLVQASIRNYFCGENLRRDDDPSLSLITGDHWLLKWNQIAFQYETGVTTQDIVYASFSNVVTPPPGNDDNNNQEQHYHPAFAIVKDRAHESLVITFRGTLSLEDCVTDVLADCQSLEEAGLEWGFDGSNVQAHQGMLEAALHVRRFLHRWNLLRPMMMMKEEDDGTRSSFPHLKVVGHSLGAGMAILLTLMLRAEFPNVMCFAYSPPGCVLRRRRTKESFAKEKKTNHVYHPKSDDRGFERMTSVIVGKDVIARSSIASYHRLRNQVLVLLAQSKVNKHVILNQLFDWKHPEELLWSSSDSEKTAEEIHYERHIEKYVRQGTTLQDQYHHVHEFQTFIPGRIVHLTSSQAAQDRDHEERLKGCWICCRPSGGVCCTKRTDYAGQWASATSFQDIRIARTMLDDHFPDKVHHVLQDVVNPRRAGDETKYTSELCI